MNGYSKTHTHLARWQLRLSALLAAVGFSLGLIACDAGEEQYDQQNPGSEGYDGMEQDHSASQTGQREKILMTDGDAGDAEDQQDGESQEAEEDEVPPDPGGRPL